MDQVPSLHRPTVLPVSSDTIAGVIEKLLESHIAETKPASEIIHLNQLNNFFLKWPSCPGFNGNRDFFDSPRWAGPLGLHDRARVPEYLDLAGGLQARGVTPGDFDEIKKAIKERSKKFLEQTPLEFFDTVAAVIFEVGIDVQSAGYISLREDWREVKKSGFNSKQLDYVSGIVLPVYQRLRELGYSHYDLIM